MKALYRKTQHGGYILIENSKLWFSKGVNGWKRKEWYRPLKPKMYEIHLLHHPRNALVKEFKSFDELFENIPELFIQAL